MRHVAVEGSIDQIGANRKAEAERRAEISLPCKHEKLAETPCFLVDTFCGPNCGPNRPIVGLLQKLDSPAAFTG